MFFPSKLWVWKQIYSVRICFQKISRKTAGISLICTAAAVILSLAYYFHHKEEAVQTKPVSMLVSLQNDYGPNPITDLKKDIERVHLRSIEETAVMKEEIKDETEEESEVPALTEGEMPDESQETEENPAPAAVPAGNPNWNGAVLSPSAGSIYGPQGKETYYNLPMDGVVSMMRGMGFSEAEYPYWVREDGCKMLGDYIIVAANLNTFPRGSTVECSLGTALVCDTGGFASYPEGATWLDIATTW